MTWSLSACDNIFYFRSPCLIFFLLFFYRWAVHMCLFHRQWWLVHVFVSCHPFYFDREVGRRRSLWLRGNHVNLSPRQMKKTSGPREENGSGRHNNLAAYSSLCQSLEAREQASKVQTVVISRPATSIARIHGKIKYNTAAYCSYLRCRSRGTRT